MTLDKNIPLKVQTHFEFLLLGGGVKSSGDGMMYVRRVTFCVGEVEGPLF